MDRPWWKCIQDRHAPSLLCGNCGNPSWFPWYRRISGALAGCALALGGVFSAIKVWEIEGMPPLLLLVACLALLLVSGLVPWLFMGWFNSLSARLCKSPWRG